MDGLLQGFGERIDFTRQRFDFGVAGGKHGTGLAQCLSVFFMRVGEHCSYVVEGGFLTVEGGHAHAFVRARSGDLCAFTVTVEHVATNGAQCEPDDQGGDQAVHEHTATPGQPALR